MPVAGSLVLVGCKPAGVGSLAPVGRKSGSPAPVGRKSGSLAPVGRKLAGDSTQEPVGCTLAEDSMPVPAMVEEGNRPVVRNIGVVVVVVEGSKLVAGTRWGIRSVVVPMAVVGHRPAAVSQFGSGREVGGICVTTVYKPMGTYTVRECCHRWSHMYHCKHYTVWANVSQWLLHGDFTIDFPKIH